MIHKYAGFSGRSKGTLSESHLSMVPGVFNTFPFALPLTSSERRGLPPNTPWPLSPSSCSAGPPCSSTLGVSGGHCSNDGGIPCAQRRCRLLPHAGQALRTCIPGEESQRSYRDGGSRVPRAHATAEKLSRCFTRSSFVGKIRAPLAESLGETYVSTCKRIDMVNM